MTQISLVEFPLRKQDVTDVGEIAGPRGKKFQENQILGTHKPDRQIVDFRGRRRASSCS